MYNNILTNGSIIDATGAPGVYEISITPTIAGTYQLFAQFNGLNVGISPLTIIVSPG